MSGEVLIFDVFLMETFSLTVRRGEAVPQLILLLSLHGCMKKESASHPLSIFSSKKIDWLQFRYFYETQRTRNIKIRGVKSVGEQIFEFSFFLRF